MNIEKEKVNDVVVLRPVGKLVIGDPIEAFRETLNSVVKDGARKVVIDLSKVDYMDSTGLGELVRAFTTLKKNNGELKLASMTSKIKDLMTMTKLLTVFENYENLDDAIKSF